MKKYLLTGLLALLFATEAFAGGINNPGSGGGSGSGVTSITSGLGLGSSAGTCGSGAITTTGTISTCTSAVIKTADYTLLNTDGSTLLALNSSSAHTFTIPQATATGNFAAGWCVNFVNLGTGVLTLSPTTSTITGAPVTLAQNGFSSICSDGTNYEGQGSAGGTALVQSLGSGLTLTSGVLTASGSVTWPTSGYVVVSNGASSPAGIAPTNGNCIVGAGGAWTSGSCSGSTSINLGTSTATASPQITGDATSGLYTAGAALVDTVISGTKIVEWSSTGENINTGNLKVQGINAFTYNAGDSTSGGSIAIGSSALVGQTTSAAYNNVAIGYQAMQGTETTAAIKNVAIGFGAGKAITSGNQNVFIGYNAGVAVTNGNTSVVIGAAAAPALIAPASLVIINGNVAGNSTTNAVGVGALTKPGQYDTAIGYNALASTSTDGKANTAVGSLAAASVTGAGANNVCVGYGSCFTGTALTTGTGNVMIGRDAQGTTAASTNRIAIGSTAISPNDNTISIGNIAYWNNKSTAAPAVSSCGTSPSIDAKANNKSGTVTVGTVAAATCTVTFAGTGYAAWNHCRVTSQSTIASFAYTYTLTTITVTGTSLVGDLFDYDCDGS